MKKKNPLKFAIKITKNSEIAPDKNILYIRPKAWNWIPFKNAKKNRCRGENTLKVALQFAKIYKIADDKIYIVLLKV